MGFVQLNVAWIFRVDTAAAKKSCLGFLFFPLEWLEGNLIDRVPQCTNCSAKQCKLLSAESIRVGIFSL